MKGFGCTYMHIDMVHQYVGVHIAKRILNLDRYQQILKDYVTIWVINAFQTVSTIGIDDADMRIIPLYFAVSRSQIRVIIHALKFNRTKSVLGRVRNSCILVLRLCCVKVASQHIPDKCCTST
jgi:hypothetical protein